MIASFHPRGIYNQLFARQRDLARRIHTLVGVYPRKLSLYRLAFSHKSSMGNGTEIFSLDQAVLENNERLEYLGDAILGSIVAEYLYTKYPTGDEGFLTKMRSKIVMRRSLNDIADNMELDVMLTNYNNTKISKSMLGNALEALVGALYLDFGYRNTKKVVIKKILRSYLDIHQLENLNHNYKSLLLEHCQKNGRAVSYELKEQYKMDKRDRFKIAVLVDGEEWADADDFNKKSAEQAASHAAMKAMGILAREQ